MATIKARLGLAASSALRRGGKNAFLKRLAPHARILDVGCGNNSPYRIKSLFPELHYTGIDIQDYNQTMPLLADEYLVATAESFSDVIARFDGVFDAVISSHNIEHCLDRAKTLAAMLRAVKPGGRLDLSFPSEQSVRFPRGRVGTLNYFDDPTHTGSPPDFTRIVGTLHGSGFVIEYQVRQYRPIVLRAIGLLVEPLSSKRKRVLQGTWEYYGFESIIWAVKRGPTAGEKAGLGR